MEMFKKATESNEEYKLRIYLYKMQNPDKMTWDDVAELMNSELDETGTSNKYRKEFTRKFRDEIMKQEDIVDDVEEELIDKVSKQLVELRKEKTVLQDLRRDANIQLRRIDREQNIKDIARDFAEVMSQCAKDFEFKSTVIKQENTKDSGLLLLSDWHYGIEIDECYNYYNPEVCKHRLQKVLNQTIDICMKERINELHIFNLSDLVSGRIHAQLRMQSRIDAVTQVMEVSEILLQFIYELSKHFKIEYYDCLDNHSRVEPNKKESLDLESFVRIIHWYLAARFEGVSNVSIHDNASSDMIVDHICGHTVVGVHGDKDTPTTVVRNISSLLGSRPDIVCMAHRHHFSADEQNTCAVLCNPSLMGADRYALDRRLTSEPAQLLVIVSEQNPTKSIHRLLAQ